MEKMNLPPFYIGQKVVYITGLNMPKNSVHIIKGLIKDPCGCWKVYIDTVNNWKPRKTTCFVKCAECNCSYHVSEVTLGNWASTSFRPVQEAKPPLIKLTLSKIKETEKEQILIEN